MGINDRETEKNDARKAARSKREAAKSRRARQTEEFNLEPLSLAKLAALAAVFATEGGALRIGKTRDGGALAVGCYMGDDYATEYIRPNKDFDSALNEIADVWLTGGAQALYEAEKWLAEGLGKAITDKAPQKGLKQL